MNLETAQRELLSIAAASHVNVTSITEAIKNFEMAVREDERTRMEGAST